MRLVTIKGSSLKDYRIDPEMLCKANRPCVLIIRLKYKGRKYDFAVPLRSNINPSTPKNLYFPLPPRNKTKPRHRHGIQYSKMFPVKKDIINNYRIAGNKQAELIKQIIDSNEKQIINECQNYLNMYEAGARPLYSTDIDLLLKLL